jgi:hypothetical protein
MSRKDAKSSAMHVVVITIRKGNIQLIPSPSLCILEVVCMSILRLHAHRCRVNHPTWRGPTYTPSSVATSGDQ